jgi:hypothetical protein
MIVRGLENYMRATRVILVCLLLFSLVLTGCEGREVENLEQMPELIDKTVEITEKAIQEKNVKLARDIWGKISEYGLKATEAGNEGLAEHLGNLASTYVHLVEYLSTGDMSKLDTFLYDFDGAINELRSFVDKYAGISQQK